VQTGYCQIPASQELAVTSAGEIQQSLKVKNYKNILILYARFVVIMLVTIRDEHHAVW
jgi:hypothetical protein